MENLEIYEWKFFSIGTVLIASICNTFCEKLEFIGCDEKRHINFIHWSRIAAWSDLNGGHYWSKCMAFKKFFSSL